MRRKSLFGIVEPARCLFRQSGDNTTRRFHLKALLPSAYCILNPDAPLPIWRASKRTRSPRGDWGEEKTVWFMTVAFKRLSVCRCILQQRLSHWRRPMDWTSEAKSRDDRSRRDMKQVRGKFPGTSKRGIHSVWSNSYTAFWRLWVEIKRWLIALET